uniref:Uncharacterized protein n=1 Tax=Megaselia scalaris TaxID=36166 RepID=T1GUU0_MEGSC
MVFAVLVPFCTPIGATSKVLQLLAILKSKDSSSVSLTTWALSAFTNFKNRASKIKASFDFGSERGSTQVAKYSIHNAYNIKYILMYHNVSYASE